MAGSLGLLGTEELTAGEELAAGADEAGAGVGPGASVVEVGAEGGNREAFQSRLLISESLEDDEEDEDDDAGARWVGP